MRSILITGADGKIGSYVTIHFRKIGYRVIKSTRKRNSIVYWSPDRVKAFYKKYRIGFVIHTAGVVDVHSDEDILFNAFGYKHLVVDKSVRYFLCGSVAEYGFQDKTLNEDSVENPDTNYALSKLMQKVSAEHSSKSEGYDIVYMRLSNVLLPNAHTSSLIETILTELPKGNKGNIIIKPHQITRDFIDIRDVCRFVETAIITKPPATVYNVCSASITKYSTLIHLFASLYKQTKNTFPNVRVPDKKRVFTKGVYSNDRARCDLGWAPQHTIQDTVQWIAGRYLRIRVVDPSIRG